MAPRRGVPSWCPGRCAVSAGGAGAVSAGEAAPCRGRRRGDVGVSRRSSCFAPSITACDALHRAIDRKVGPQSCFRPCKGPPLHCSLPSGSSEPAHQLLPPGAWRVDGPGCPPDRGRPLSPGGSPCAVVHAPRRGPCAWAPAPRALHGGRARPHRPARQPRRPQAVRGRCLPLASGRALPSWHLSGRPLPTRSSACSAALAGWAPRP